MTRMTEQLLGTEDLAYMREEQTLVRPTPCTITPKASETSDGMGGTTDTPGGTRPVMARISHVTSRAFTRDVPQDLADRYGISVLVRIHLDLTPVHPGDRLTVDATGRDYQIVSDGSVNDEWATVQIVWGVAQ
jgi:hypothetical protein